MVKVLLCDGASLHDALAHTVTDSWILATPMVSSAVFDMLIAHPTASPAAKLALACSHDRPDLVRGVIRTVFCRAYMGDSSDDTDLDDDCASGRLDFPICMLVNCANEFSMGVCKAMCEGLDTDDTLMMQLAALGEHREWAKELCESPHASIDVALCTSLACGLVEVVKDLLECGADCNAQDVFDSHPSNDTPIKFARSPECFRLVVEFGDFSPDERLCWASRAGLLDEVRTALNDGASLDGVFEGEFDAGVTNALQVACINGHLPIVELLCASDADPNCIMISFSQVKSTLDLAIHNVDIVRVLLAHGAQWYAEHLLSSSVEVTRLLLGSVNQIDRTKFATTALVDACASRKPVLRIVEALCEAGADVNTSHTSAECRFLRKPAPASTPAPLVAAVIAQNEELLQVLLKAGAEADKPVGRIKLVVDTTAAGNEESIIRLANRTPRSLAADMALFAGTPLKVERARRIIGLLASQPTPAASASDGLEVCAGSKRRHED